MPYLPIMSMFCPGDILLVRNNSITSRVIRAVTRGGFSHAMICVHPPTMIEAVPGHVRNVTLARCYIDDINKVRVLRYPSKSIAERAGREASFWLDTPYSALSALYSVRKKLIKNPDGGVFCSRLVAEAFRNAGADLLPNMLTEKITPESLENAKTLEDVTNSVFEIAPQGYKIDELSALDIEILPWVVEPLVEKRRACAENVIPALQIYINNYSPKGQIWPSFMGIIKLLEVESKNLEKGSSLKRTSLDLIDQALFEAIKKNDLSSAYAEIIKRQNVDTRRLLEDSFKINPIFDINSLEQHLALSGRFERRKIHAVGLLNFAECNDFHGVKSFAKLELNVVESLENFEKILKEVIERRSG